MYAVFGDGQRSGETDSTKPSAGQAKNGVKREREKPQVRGNQWESGIMNRSILKSMISVANDKSDEQNQDSNMDQNDKRDKSHIKSPSPRKDHAEGSKYFRGKKGERQHKGRNSPYNSYDDNSRGSRRSGQSQGSAGKRRNSPQGYGSAGVASISGAFFRMNPQPSNPVFKRPFQAGGDAGEMAATQEAGQKRWLNEPSNNEARRALEGSVAESKFEQTNFSKGELSPPISTSQPQSPDLAISYVKVPAPMDSRAILPHNFAISQIPIENTKLVVNKNSKHIANPFKKSPKLNPSSPHIFSGFIASPRSEISPNMTNMPPFNLSQASYTKKYNNYGAIPRKTNILEIKTPQNMPEIGTESVREKFKNLVEQTVLEDPNRNLDLVDKLKLDLSAKEYQPSKANTKGTIQEEFKQRIKESAMLDTEASISAPPSTPARDRDQKDTAVDPEENTTEPAKIVTANRGKEADGADQQAEKDGQNEIEGSHEAALTALTALAAVPQTAAGNTTEESRESGSYSSGVKTTKELNEEEIEKNLRKQLDKIEEKSRKQLDKKDSESQKSKILAKINQSNIPPSRPAPEKKFYSSYTDADYKKSQTPKAMSPAYMVRSADPSAQQYSQRVMQQHPPNLQPYQGSSYYPQTEHYRQRPEDLGRASRETQIRGSPHVLLSQLSQGHSYPNAPILQGHAIANAAKISRKDSAIQPPSHTFENFTKALPPLQPTRPEVFSGNAAKSYRADPYRETPSNAAERGADTLQRVLKEKNATDRAEAVQAQDRAESEATGVGLGKSVQRSVEETITKTFDGVAEAKPDAAVPPDNAISSAEKKSDKNTLEKTPSSSGQYSVQELLSFQKNKLNFDEEFDKLKKNSPNKEVFDIIFKKRRCGIVEVGEFWKKFARSDSRGGKPMGRYNSNYKPRREYESSRSLFGASGSHTQSSRYNTVNKAPVSKNTMTKIAIKQNVDKKESLQNSFNGLLNKLSEDNFEKISKKIYERIVKDQTYETFEILVQAIFSKALNEHRYSHLYSRLVDVFNSKFKGLMTVMPSGKTERLIFKNILVECIEKRFKEMDESKNKDETIFKQNKIKDQDLGNIKFAGELYLIHLIKSKVMTDSILILLDKVEPSEKDFDVLCKLLRTIGVHLDSDKEKGIPEEVKRIYTKINKFVSTLSTGRTKFLLMDILDLRKNQWKSLDKKSVKVDSKQSVQKIQKAAPTSQDIRKKGGNKIQESEWTTSNAASAKLVENRKNASSSAATRQDSRKESNKPKELCVEWNEKLSNKENYQAFVNKQGENGNIKNLFLEFAIVFTGAESQKAIIEAYKDLLYFVTDNLLGKKYNQSDLLSFVKSPFEKSLIDKQHVSKALVDLFILFPEWELDFPFIVESFAKVFNALLEINAVELEMLGSLGLEKFVLKIVIEIAAIFNAGGKSKEFGVLLKGTPFEKIDISGNNKEVKKLKNEPKKKVEVGRIRNDL